MINLFNIFRKKRIMNSGALLDDRSDECKMADFTFNEAIASINPVNWVEKPQSEWRKFPIMSQNSSGACVAFSVAKLLSIMYWLKQKEK